MLNMTSRLDLFLGIILHIIFLVALLSGLNIIIGGATSVPGATPPVDVSVDNEIRFFAVFWVAYGFFCLIVARNLEHHRSFIPFIAIVFFLGGVGRLISTLLVGMPSSILVPAMIIELALPLLIYILHRKHRQISLIQQSV